MIVQPYARIARTMCSVTYQDPRVRGLRPHSIASARSSSRVGWAITAGSVIRSATFP